MGGAVYGFYFDGHGFIHTKRYLRLPEHQNESYQPKEYPVASWGLSQQRRRVSPAWLRFIVIFWSPRVLRAAVKFGVAAMIMNKYERIGFAIMMLCFAF